MFSHLHDTVVVIIMVNLDLVWSFLLRDWDLIGNELYLYYSSLVKPPQQSRKN